MGKVLTKQYKRWEPGTILTSDQDEYTQAERDRGLAHAAMAEPSHRTAYVNAERMQQLEREGYF